MLLRYISEHAKARNEKEKPQPESDIHIKISQCCLLAKTAGSGSGEKQINAIEDGGSYESIMRTILSLSRYDTAIMRPLPDG